ncbi:hypothetical protein F4679DRAFT_584745 [Xylaria curta]|nr:hypothetical protein F4679DRAFT_584745 [Xylaria curta]
MQIPVFLTSVMFFGAHLAAAAPAEDMTLVKKADQAASIFKRDITNEYCGSNDDGFEYDASHVTSSFLSMQVWVNFPSNLQLNFLITASAGGVTYPHQYGARDTKVIAALNAIDGCQTGQPGFKYFEYPLTTDLWIGGPARSQGPDRVIGIGKSPGQGGQWKLTYCLSVTHTGQPNNILVPCTDTD